MTLSSHSGKASSNGRSGLGDGIFSSTGAAAAAAATAVVSSSVSAAESVASVGVFGLDVSEAGVLGRGEFFPFLSFLPFCFPDLPFLSFLPLPLPLSFLPFLPLSSLPFFLPLLPFFAIAAAASAS